MLSKFGSEDIRKASPSTKIIAETHIVPNCKLISGLMALMLLCCAGGTAIFVKAGVARLRIRSSWCISWLSCLGLAIWLRKCWSRTQVSPYLGALWCFILTNPFPEQRRVFLFYLFILFSFILLLLFWFLTAEKFLSFKAQVISLNFTDKAGRE